MIKFLLLFLIISISLVFAEKPDYYQVLQIPRDASLRDIKKAFRKLSLIHHPDRNKSADPKMFINIKQAYDCLKDPEKRQFYDEGGVMFTDDGLEDFVASQMNALFKGQFTYAIKVTGFAGLLLCMCCCISFLLCLRYMFRCFWSCLCGLFGFCKKETVQEKDKKEKVE